VRTEESWRQVDKFNQLHARALICPGEQPDQQKPVYRLARMVEKVDLAQSRTQHRMSQPAWPARQIDLPSTLPVAASRALLASSWPCLQR
jgi:hypothetical protein